MTADVLLPALFGLLGTIVGAGVTWVSEALNYSRARRDGTVQAFAVHGVLKAQSDDPPEGTTPEERRALELEEGKAFVDRFAALIGLGLGWAETMWVQEQYEAKNRPVRMAVHRLIAAETPWTRARRRQALRRLLPPGFAGT